jgi:type IV pilus assembly protein PilW
MVQLTGGATSNVPLVEGIESVRFEYSLDTDSNGVIDSIRRCKAGVDSCDLAAWSSVVSIQIRLLARNIAKSNGYSDAKSYDMGLAGTITPSSDAANYPVAYKRHLYMSKITAFNLSGPRE